MVSSSLVASIRGWGGSVPQAVEEHRGQVALPEARDDDDDRLALVGGTLRDLLGRGERGAGGQADEQPVERGGPAGEVDGGVDVDVDDLVVDAGVEGLGNEVGADALDLVRTGLAAVEDRGLLGLDADECDLGLALLEGAADAGDRAARADRRDDDVDRAVGVRQISSAVVAAWMAGLASLANWRARMPPRSATICSAFSTAPRMPSGPGVRTSSAPKARRRALRSALIVSGMARTTSYPRAAPTIARAMPVFPLVASTIVPPGWSSPDASAASTIATPMRSLTEFAGL